HDPWTEGSGHISEEAGDGGTGAMDRPAFTEVLSALRQGGLEVLHAAFLPPSQLCVGCSDAIALTIDGDPFLLYMFRTAAQASHYAAHTIAARASGRFVFRSDPPAMYVFPGGVLYGGDDRVRWSSLLAETRFARALQRIPVPDEHHLNIDRSANGGIP